MVPCEVHELPRDVEAHEHSALRGMTNDERLAHARMTWISYSEVCCHMSIAGARLPVVPLAHNMAQVLNADGSLFSFPITRGEAGLHEWYA